MRYSDSVRRAAAAGIDRLEKIQARYQQKQMNSNHTSTDCKKFWMMNQLTDSVDLVSKDN